MEIWYWQQNGRAWPSADFFPGEGKIFQEGQKHTICLKNTKKVTIFLEKSRKTYYFGRPGGGARAPSCPPLRTPMRQSLEDRSCMAKSKKSNDTLPNPSSNKMYQISGSILVQIGRSSWHYRPRMTRSDLWLKTRRRKKLKCWIKRWNRPTERKIINFVMPSKSWIKNFGIQAVRVIQGFKYLQFIKLGKPQIKWGIT